MTAAVTGTPSLSIVVIFHNMVREAERTLFTLSADYQIGVSAEDYEIIAIDNGSDLPLSPNRVSSFGPNIKYQYLDTASVSPVDAVDLGGEAACGQFVAVIVDGARMASPGLVRATLSALEAMQNPFVCALAWHLGPDVQNTSISNGYNQEIEDDLLDSIDWRNNGYRLFEISTLAQSSGVGFLGGLPSECSWLALPRKRFQDIGGFDSRFRAPGGGLVNHDFLKRISADPTTGFVVLLGEGSFHQMHGGVATNCPLAEHPMARFQEEYRSIHGKDYAQTSLPAPYYLGSLSPQMLKFVNPDLAWPTGLNEAASTFAEPK
jgi:hypothetical protein